MAVARFLVPHSVRPLNSSLIRILMLQAAFIRIIKRDTDRLQLTLPSMVKLGA